MNNKADEQYLNLCRRILSEGVSKSDRTGTGTISIFDCNMTFDMSEGFPLLTSKKVFLKGIIHELIWFINGDTNIRYLLENDVHIWDGDCFKNYKTNGGDLNKEDFINKLISDSDFCKKWGDLGPIYGHQWRNWNGYKEQHLSKEKDNKGFLKFYEKEFKGIDQLKILIDNLKNNPDTRRLIVSSWNVSSLGKMVLPPCHNYFECYTYEMSLDERKREWCKTIGKDISYAFDFYHKTFDEINFPSRKLSLKWNQRSIDVPLGLPYNIASYAILLNLLSKEVNMIPDKLILSGGDCHIYKNQIDAIKEQFNNETFELPTIELSNNSLFDVKYDDIKVMNYKSSKAIKIPLSN